MTATEHVVRLSAYKFGLQAYWTVSLSVVRAVCGKEILLGQIERRVEVGD